MAVDRQPVVDEPRLPSPRDPQRVVEEGSVVAEVVVLGRQRERRRRQTGDARIQRRGAAGTANGAIRSTSYPAPARPLATPPVWASEPPALTPNQRLLLTMSALREGPATAAIRGSRSRLSRLAAAARRARKPSMLARPTPIVDVTMRRREIVSRAKVGLHHLDRGRECAPRHSPASSGRSGSDPGSSSAITHGRPRSRASVPSELADPEPPQFRHAQVLRARRPAPAPAARGMHARAGAP